MCDIYIFQNNIQTHYESTEHKISNHYFQNDIIHIFGVQSEGRILSSRIVSLKSKSIHEYFNSIDVDLVELIGRLIKFQKNKRIRVTVKMFVLYNTKLTSASEQLGTVKMYNILDEVSIFYFY